ncbi:hypothetical protein, partial [Streptomyces sp. NRRL S-15]|uniref:hypothetical protein n=1 Tax=Streptomyces sp. NRRL S-15 TaxID=1463886 RepID=UPI001F297CD8
DKPAAQLGSETRRALIDQGFEVKEFGNKGSGVWVLSEDTPRARDAVQPGLNVAQGAAASFPARLMYRIPPVHGKGVGKVLDHL